MITRTIRWGQGRSEIGVALFLLVLGILMLIDAARIRSGLGVQGPVGPKAIPTVIGILLVTNAVLLAWDVMRGGRGEPDVGEDVDLSQGTDRRAMLLLAASFMANIALIERAGWPISGAVLFYGCAYALGSRHYIRDAIIAVALSVGTWYLFAVGLGIGLPVGILKGIL
ncbi:tripartite tricarboxylate transporter TctB family protein [Dactylosporangium roseum]|uniref:Tripartite tricarboxylate transporter TctB family protein n=1 Tax=Dactylosporangium roseum TaxID=47989 RepID=A0ABY5YX79_9ACTN|nr:tripartite tricarboxylate transporter TctB family protein [Dactylosporangium roseum]UWZ34371.1 tripartite tricarboxylate transporter TctB family protein [Dactylosporangium roseum]